MIDTPERSEVVRDGVGLESSARCCGVVFVFTLLGNFVGSSDTCEPGASASACADESISEVERRESGEANIGVGRRV